MRLMLLALPMIMIAPPVAAQSMNAETFFQRANKLKAKGAMAVFSGGEIKTLMREGQAAGKAATAAHRAAKAAGRPTRFCPPEGPQKMGSDEYMTKLAAIPAVERRRIDMTEATIRIMAMKFPCRA